MNCTAHQRCITDTSFKVGFMFQVAERLAVMMMVSDDGD